MPIVTGATATIAGNGVRVHRPRLLFRAVKSGSVSRRDAHSAQPRTGTERRRFPVAAREGRCRTACAGHRRGDGGGTAGRPPSPVTTTSDSRRASANCARTSPFTSASPTPVWAVNSATGRAARGPRVGRPRPVPRGPVGPAALSHVASLPSAQSGRRPTVRASFPAWSTGQQVSRTRTADSVLVNGVDPSQTSAVM